MIKMSFLKISILACVLMLSGCGCSRNMGDRVISGALIGAGTGLATGAIVGEPVAGVLIGGVVGGAIGGFVDDEYINLGDPIWRY